MTLDYTGFSVNPAEEVFDSPYLAYIKKVTVHGQNAYAIFSGDGVELAVVGNRDVAFAAALQHEYLPVSVH